LTRRGGPIDSAGNSNTTFSIANRQSPIANQQSAMKTWLSVAAEARAVVAIPARTANHAALAGMCKLKSKKLCTSIPQHPMAARALGEWGGARWG